MDSTETTDCRAARRRIPAWLGLGLRVAVTAAFIAFLYYLVPWRDHEIDGRVEPGIVSVISGADWRWCVAGVLTALLVQVLAGIRWAALARPLGFDFPRRFFVWRFFEGACFSLFLPSSIGGDVVKALRLGDTTSRRVLAGCSLVADRLTGVAALGVICGSAFLATWWRLGLVATFAVAAGLFAAVTTAFWIGVGSLDRVLQFIPLPVSARAFAGRLLPYQQRPSLMVKAVAWSLLVQMGGAMSVSMLGRAVGVEQPFSVWFTVVPLLALAMVVPLTVNGIGVREGGMIALLALHGVPKTPAGATALLWFATTIIGGLVGGVLFLLDRNPSAAPTSGVTTG